MISIPSLPQIIQEWLDNDLELDRFKVRFSKEPYISCTCCKGLFIGNPAIAFIEENKVGYFDNKGNPCFINASDPQFFEELKVKLLIIHSSGNKDLDLTYE